MVIYHSAAILSLAIIIAEVCKFDFRSRWVELNITSCDKDADFVQQIALLLISLCGVISLGFLILCFGIVQIAQSKSNSGNVTSDIFTFIFYT